MKLHFLHHILLPVADIERAATFYQKLGMERVPSLSVHIAWMQCGPNQLHLWKNDALHRYSGWTHEPSPHFALEVDSIAEALDLIPRLGGDILHTLQRRPHNDSWYLFALDPDGNRFELMQSTHLD